MSRKLKGHRPACKCVGCSAETRRRGMKALGLHKNRARVSKGAEGGRIVGKSRKSRRKLLRKAKAAFERLDRAQGSKISKLAEMKKYPNRGPRSLPLKTPYYKWQFSDKKARAAMLDKAGVTEEHDYFVRVGFESLPEKVRTALRLSNPLTRKGRKIKRAMRKFYGKKKGARVFYASARKGKIRGVLPRREASKAERAQVKRAARRHSNPAKRSGGFIGDYPVLHVGGDLIRIWSGKLRTGPGEHRVSIYHSGANTYKNLLGKNVRAIDYTNDAKALRAYGKVAPFRHVFTHAARIVDVKYGLVTIESKERIWEKQK